MQLIKNFPHGGKRGNQHTQKVADSNYSRLPEHSQKKWQVRTHRT